MTHSLLCVMTYTLLEQKVDGKHIISRYERIKEQNAFHVTNKPPILRLKPKDYFYATIFLRDETVCIYPKEAAMSASDDTETAYRDVRIFMRLMECCVFIQHFDDV